MKWKAPEMTTTEQRGFTGVYDAEGHRADVIRRMNKGKTGAELLEIGRQRRAQAQQILTDDEVLEIRAAYRYGNPEASLNALAHRYGVSQHTIRLVVIGLRYREVAA